MEDREALKTLAAKLNDARWLANTIAETEDQRGVYGDISKSLKEVLGMLVDTRAHVEAAYDCLLDGCTVEEALRQVYSL